MRNQPVRAEEAKLDMFVGERNATEESSLGEVHIQMVGMVAPAATNDYHLASYG